MRSCCHRAARGEHDSSRDFFDIDIHTLCTEGVRVVYAKTVYTRAEWDNKKDVEESLMAQKIDENRKTGGK